MNKLIKNNTGFTLTELLISIVISLLILIIVSTTFTLNQRVFRKSILKAELVQNARVSLDLMAREIRQAKEIATPLPADDSNPDLVAHELEFEDGHIESQIQYVRYYLDGSNFKRQIVVYFFDTDHNTYVYWDDIDAFGGPENATLEEKIIAENFSNLNFYGNDNINIELILQKRNEQIKIESLINPRNI